MEWKWTKRAISLVRRSKVKACTALNLELEITTTSGGSAKLWEVFSMRAHWSTAPERPDAVTSASGCALTASEKRQYEYTYPAEHVRNRISLRR
jgi:hypothetical protein